MWRIALCFTLVGALALFATCAVRVHGHLLEAVCSNDWYIRLPVQWAAGHDLGGHAVPPRNPLFTLLGRSAPMRYYYFFYALCGEPMRLFGLSARSVMVGGVVWAGTVFFSVAMLLVKYLVASGGMAVGLQVPSLRYGMTSAQRGRKLGPRDRGLCGWRSCFSR